MSSDRLFRVREKQPYSNKSASIELSIMNGTKPHIMETVKVGDMCVFNKDNGWEIGRIL